MKTNKINRERTLYSEVAYRVQSLCAAVLLCVTSLYSQGARPGDLKASPQPVGAAGVMWYTTWETALEEAERSGRPIFFMAAAATCSGIPGVF